MEKKIEIQYEDGKYLIREVFESGANLLAMCRDEKEAQEVAKVFMQRREYGEISG